MRSLLLCAFLVAGTAVFSACEKKEETPAPTTTPTTTDTTSTNPVSTVVFKAKIDSTDWKASNHNTSVSGGSFGLYGTSADKITLIIYTDEITRTGIYTSGTISIEKDNPDNSYNRWTAYLNDSVQNELNITKYDPATKKISGTFHFKTSFYMGIPADSAAKTVTEGVFTDIKIP